MAFVDEARKHSAFISSHIFGETIAYRSWPSLLWRDFDALVSRQPVDAVGKFMENVAMVRVAKTAVTEVTIGKDEIELLTDKRPQENPPRYVVKAATERLGCWVLECERKT